MCIFNAFPTEVSCATDWETQPWARGQRGGNSRPSTSSTDKVTRKRVHELITHLIGLDCGWYFGRMFLRFGAAWIDKITKYEMSVTEYTQCPVWTAGVAPLSIGKEGSSLSIVRRAQPN